MIPRKKVYIHLKDNDCPVQVELLPSEVMACMERLQESRYDFVKFGDLVLPKSNIEKVKITEVGK